MLRETDMEEKIIARLKTRDGFIKEMPISEFSPHISMVDLPRIEVIQHNNRKHSGLIKREFFAREKKIIIDYEEI